MDSTPQMLIQDSFPTSGFCFFFHVESVIQTSFLQDNFLNESGSVVAVMAASLRN